MDLDDEDDDLPQPGRVWTGPSLAALSAQPHTLAKSPHPSPPPEHRETGHDSQAGASASNIEPVNPTNLPEVWRQLLGLLAAKGPMLQSLVTPGRLVDISNGFATIRYAAGQETFVKLLERNGKREIVRDKLAEVLGQSIGIKFEVDKAPEGAQAPAPTNDSPAPTPASSARPAPQSRAAPAPAPEAPPAPAAPVIKLTPELIESLRTVPLVKALMDQMGAAIVKVE